jgi:hypothetical protein
MMKENLGEFLELEDERRGKGRLGFQTWVRIFGMLQCGCNILILCGQIYGSGLGRHGQTKVQRGVGPG